nr:MAG TPA: minor structural protein [Caudoviricetes sp.]
MAYDFLKKLYGVPKEGEKPKAMTYEELEAAIDADGSIKLADLSGGGYVSKEKYNAKVTELTGVKQQLTDANTEIQSYKDMDIEGIQKSAKEWEDKYNADTKALEDKLTAQEYSHAADMFMSKYQFTSKPAREGVMAEFNKKGFKLEDGKFLGAEEYMNSLMESEDYKGAFKVEEKPEVKEPEKKPFFAASTQSHSNPENTPEFSFGFTGVRKHD